MSKNEEIAVDPLNMQSSDFSDQITWKKFTFISNMFHIEVLPQIFVCLCACFFFDFFVLLFVDVRISGLYTNWRNIWHLHQYSQWKSLW